MPEQILAAVLDTPIGPLSLLAHCDRLIAGGFTARPDEMYTRLTGRSAGSRSARWPPATCPGWPSRWPATSPATCARWTRSRCTSRAAQAGSGSGRS